MKRAAIVVVGLVLFVLAFVAATALAGAADKPPSPPGQGECQHGNSGKPCRDDPQPDRGKDCEEHGPKEGGVNEDHCKGVSPPTDTEPTETTPTDTTPTDTTPTTTTTTTEEEPSPVEPQPTPTEQSSSTTAPGATPPAAPAPSSPKPPAAGKKKSKAAVTIVKTKKQSNGVVVVTTADGKQHVAIQGQG